MKRLLHSSKFYLLLISLLGLLVVKLGLAGQADIEQGLNALIAIIVGAGPIILALINGIEDAAEKYAGQEIDLEDILILLPELIQIVLAELQPEEEEEPLG